MSLTDNEDATQYFDRLCDIADGEGFSSLSAPERIAVLVWWAKALVDNGGFQYFYEGACNADDVAGAFVEIGLDYVADAFRESLHVFPHQIPSPNHELRQLWLRQQNAAVEQAFEGLNEVVWEVAETELLDKLRAYAAAHESSFKRVQVD